MGSASRQTAQRCIWRSSRCGTSWSSRVAPAAHAFASRRSIACSGRGCRSDGAAGARRCISCSRRRCSPGIGAAFACSGRGRADTALGAPLSRTTGTYLSTELFYRLGVADRVLPKSRRIEGGKRVGTVVARGEAEIGFQQISELLPIDGIDFVGPLRPEVQRVTIFSGGVGTASTNPAVAKSFIDFLASSAAIRIIRKTSLEAVAVEP